LLPKREGRGSQGPRDGQPLAEPHAALSGVLSSSIGTRRPERSS
jgi:hypothetical protein